MVEHSKVWESILIAGGIVLAFGIIWGAFLLASNPQFTTAQGAVILVVIGVLLLIIAESVLLTVRGKRK